jgi:hypothetical protein
LSARLVRPDDAEPDSSLIAPTGKPPQSNSSTVAIPVAATSRIVLGAGVSAAGNLCFSACSISKRSAAAEDIRTRAFGDFFAFYSPKLRQDTLPVKKVIHSF